jgi:hypothetical protein
LVCGRNLFGGWAIPEGLEVQSFPVIEDQQAFMKSETDLFKLKPVFLTNDGPALRVRRMVKEKIRLEQAGTQPADALGDGKSSPIPWS